MNIRLLVNDRVQLALLGKFFALAQDFGWAYEATVKNVTNSYLHALEACVYCTQANIAGRREQLTQLGLAFEVR